MNLEVTAYLGLGSNMGDKKTHLEEALKHLKNVNGIQIIKHSSVYLTEPMGVTRQPDFYNAVVEIKTSLTPLSLLAEVKQIEYSMGREPNSHFKPRPIDIDILLYGDSEINTLNLLIPHSRLTRRAFVLVPLLELNSELLHPISFKPLKGYLGDLKDSQKVERVINAGDFAGEPKES